MPIFEHIKQFVAWIGGAVGGVTILFYAAGFLVNRAHITMLGLAGVLEHTHEILLYEGAKFFFTVTTYSLKSALLIGITLLIAAFIVMLLGHLSWVGRAEQTVKQYLGVQRHRLNERSPGFLRVGALAVLSGLFVWHTQRFFYPLQDIYTGVEYVLYKSVSAKPLKNCADAEVSQQENSADRAKVVVLWLQQGENCRKELLKEFEKLLAGYLLLLLAVGYLFFQKPTEERSGIHRVAFGTLAVYGLLYTLLLPIAFGVLVRSPIYPLAKIKWKTDIVETPDTFQLLSRNAGSLLVWDGIARKATWLRIDDAAEISVHGQANLFTQPSKGGKMP